MFRLIIILLKIRHRKSEIRYSKLRLFSKLNVDQQFNVFTNYYSTGFSYTAPG